MFLTMSDHSPHQRGNVLFLILIAVVLFAVLSYAVTSSTRSGDGNASKETTAVEGAWLQNYGSALASAITRMRINQNIATEDLCFFAPANPLYSNTTYQSRNPFHPQGGGSLFEAPPKTLAGTFVTGFMIALVDLPNVGTSGPSGSDIIMVVTGIKKSACDAVNKRVNTPLYQDFFMLTSITPTTAPAASACISNLPYPGAWPPAAFPGLSGLHEACIENMMFPGLYYYYRVLVER